jgi:uncharacterized SAM-binding protein YcdF (DUF218 family)
VRQKFYRIVPFLILLPGLVLLGEFTFFLKMTHSGPVLEKADLIAVFTGEGGRVEEGYRLANQGYGGHLVVSRASPQSLEYYRKKLSPSNAFETLVEDKSRTTFENALHTRWIMSEHGMRSVILVTSWDHMPRSYLLLRILSHGADIRIRCSSASTGKLDTASWYRFSEGWKRVYNEMIELWGSLYELTKYSILGTLPEKAPNQSPVVAFLRKMLLFDMEPIHS